MVQMTDNGRTDGELLAAYADKHDVEAFKELHRKYAGLVYSLAMRYLNNSQDAEDAATGCFVVLLRKADSLKGRDNLGGWFHWCAVRTAKNALMARIHRAEREQEAYAMRANEEQENRFETMMPELEAGIAELPSKMREALVMYFYQGYTQAQIAVGMRRPEGTIATWIKRGVEKLRNYMGADGSRGSDEEFCRNFSRYAVVLPVPATLSGKLALLAEGKTIGGSAVSLADRVLHGIFLAQLKTAAAVVCGVALIGGGVFGLTALAQSGAADGKKSDTPVQTSKFSTPATDPEAEWEDKGFWSGSRATGYLDGPRLEAMSFTSPRPGAFTEDGGENIYRTYDPKTDRLMTLAGCGSEGDLDGPFSRARFGGWGYANSSGLAGNSRYGFIISFSKSRNRNVLRRFDFKKRIVESLEVNVDGSGTCGFDGGLFLQNGDRIRKIDNDGKLIAEYKLDKAPRESLGPYDPKNDRLYGSSREGQGGWVAWGWDLKAGGKFFGVLPDGHPGENKPLRKQCATGPFKGSFFYCPGGLSFGPGDPEYRYLYMGGGDEANVYRLDLEKEVWVKLVKTADGKRWHFGDAPGLVQAWEAGGGIPWAVDGSDNMMCGYRGWSRTYERVK